MSYVTAITLIHSAISLIQIPLGVMAVRRLFDASVPINWTRSFLITAFLTAATGFLFPFKGITPALVVSVLAIIILAVMAYALPRRFDAALWRRIWAGGMVLSLYLDVFVGIVQAFLKIPVLHQFAPNGAEPPFAATQGVALIIFLIIGTIAVRRYRP